MGKPDDAKPQDLLSETMKNLMPPRVELTREQFEALQKLSKKTGKSVKELLRRAIDRYVSEQAAK